MIRTRRKSLQTHNVVDNCTEGWRRRSEHTHCCSTIMNKQVCWTQFVNPHFDITICCQLCRQSQSATLHIFIFTPFIFVNFKQNNNELTNQFLVISATTFEFQVTPVTANSSLLLDDRDKPGPNILQENLSILLYKVQFFLSDFCLT